MAHKVKRSDGFVKFLLKVLSSTVYMHYLLKKKAISMFVQPPLS